MLGYIHDATRGTTNTVLVDLSERLIREGFRVTGLIQSRAPKAGDHPCDMDLKCLPDGPSFAIAQHLGSGSRGCRMDVDSLEMAVASVAAEIEKGADLLIVNKFGAQEAQGRGFCPVIARALELGTPVLTVVNPLNLAAFVDFAGGMAVEVKPQVDGLAHWVTTSRPQPAGQ